VSEQINVIVQQQQRLFREGLALLVSADADLSLAGTAVTDVDLAALCDDLGAGVVLFEIDADDWDGSRLAVTLGRRHPQLTFVGVAVAPTATDASRARLAGVHAVVGRGDGFEVLREAVLASAAADAPTAAMPPRADRRSSLTGREIDVLGLVGAGWTSREISDRLEISHKTVENHKQRIFDKLGVQSQSHAVAVALRRGIISAEGVSELVAES
jgi:DNA-binding NarL/FixJ family response regulator